MNYKWLFVFIVIILLLVMSEVDRFRLKREIRKSEKERNKYFRFYCLTIIWLKKRINGEAFNIKRICNTNNTVVIYGAGHIGKQMYYELRSRNVEVPFFIDKQLKASCCGREVLSIKEFGAMDKSNIDAILVTPFDHFNEIKSELENCFSANIVSVEEVIYGDELL